MHVQKSCYMQRKVKQMNVVVTGVGIVSAIGNNEEEVLSSLLSMESGIGKMRNLDSIHKDLPVGEVKMSNDEMKQLAGIPVAEQVCRTSLLGIIAVNQLEDQLPKDPKQRIALISGTTVGTMDLTERHYDTFLSESDVSFFRQHGCGGSTQRIADHFGIFHDVATVSTACSSAANAIILGANMIKAGEADIVVAGGSEALSRFHLDGFNSLMILDKERCRPFDSTRAGLNLGEGAAYVVLETEKHARERGAKIRAWLTGYGNACDAYHQTASSPDGEGAFLAMNEALQTAGLKPEDIQYVNAHGTGTPNNDQSESVALRRIFSDTMPPVSSTKAFTGHTTSASGAIETVICLIAMKNGFVPANLGWKEQMQDGITPTLGMKQATLHNVVCNSFGFGGNDSSLVFSASSPYGAAQLTITDTSSKRINVLSRIEIKSVDELSAIRNYVKPIEARRMGKLMKASLLSSLRALKEAGIEKPDAIITATAYGCLDNTVRLLDCISDGGEETVSPTYFMQSTHNTIGSNIAIRLHCHGYNSTYSQGRESLDWALRDARLLLQSGKVKTVLVGCHDEANVRLNAMLKKAGMEVPEYEMNSLAMVLSCGE